MDFSQLGNARYAVLGVIVLVALWAGLKAWKWFAGAGERALAQQLADAIAAGDAKLAGDIQVRRGNLVEASRIFVRANEHARAGTVLAMLGQHKEAAEEYEKGSEWSKAGPLFKRVGDLARAAACFERSSERSDRMQAAECWFAGDEYLKAARLFQDCEEYERAADAFTKVDDLDALEVALTMLENAAIAEKDNAKRKKRLWTRAGEVGFKLGAHERAARAFDEAGETMRAADVYENALKKLDMAAVLYAEAGDTEKAERLTRAAGGEERVRETRLARARTRSADTEKSASDKPGKRASDRSDDRATDKGSNKSGGETGATVVKKAVQSDAIDPTLPAAADARPERESRKKSLDLGDRFEMAGELGRGGMGIVYRAKDQRLGRFVALKFLPDDVEAGSTMSRLFRREARAAAALSHPGIVTVYDVGEIDGREFIAMELVEGKTLDRTLEENGPLPINEALDVMEKVLEAIEYAHGKSVIHRDIKPANLMRTKTGIKVMDFGLAKVIGSKSSGQTLVGGTPNYMPPEQSTGHADHRSDVFALGVTFYELLTGELPGRPGEPASVSSSYPTPRERVAAIPPRLSELIMHCLERERELRTQDVVSVLREVRSIKAELVSSPPKAPRAGPAAAPRAASTMARTEAAPRNAASPRRADPIPRDEDPIPRRDEPRREEPRREEPRREEPRREERRDEPRRAEVRPVASTPAAQRKPLPARIAREEEDDDAGVPRVERLGPIDKSDGRKRR